MKKGKIRVYFRKPFPEQIMEMLTGAMTWASKLEITDAVSQADVIIVSAIGSCVLLIACAEESPQARIVALVAPSATSNYRQECFDVGADAVDNMPERPQDCRVIMKSIGG